MIAVFFGAGLVFAGIEIGKKQISPTPVPNTNVTTEPSVSPSNETTNWKTYTNTKYGFEIKYPSEAVDVKNDNEIEYSRESKIDIPDGFTKFMGYKPPPLVTAIKVMNKTSSSSSYAFDPFNVWVFDNSKGISIDQWYRSFWYYPFNWGQAIESVVESNRPKYTKMVNNIEIKYTISDGMGPVEYGYASQNGKMILFATEGKLGNQILSTFKFIEPSTVNRSGFTYVNQKYGYSIIIPLSWQGKYEIREKNNNPSFYYSSLKDSRKHLIFRIGVSSIAEWENLLKGPNPPVLIQKDEANNRIYFYNISLDNPYGGEVQDDYFSMFVNLKGIISTFKFLN